MINQKKNPIREANLLFQLARKNCTTGKSELPVGFHYCNLIQRRFINEPFAYISEKKDFYNATFKVNQYTLIPRPDSELLVESALEIIKKEDFKKPLSILELGVGSGAIILSIMKEIKKNFSSLFPLIKWKGTDISNDTLSVAKENAEQLSIDKFIEFECRNWIDGMNIDDYDIIISNPPYIPTTVIDSLNCSVKEYV